MRTIGPLRRVGYSFLGLLAGDAVLALYLLVNTVRVWVLYHWIRPGEPHLRIEYGLLFIMPLYAVFSVFGWILVGIPAVLAIPTRSIVRFSMWILLPVGAAFGPLSLAMLFRWMNHGPMSLDDLMHISPFLIFAGVVSTVAFAVHCALVRRAARPRPGGLV